MTGHCESKRAVELMILCCERVYQSPGEYSAKSTFTKKLNGAPVFVMEGRVLNYYTTPIEHFLYFYKQYCSDESHKIRRLVKFLKGETEELVL